MSEHFDAKLFKKDIEKDFGASLDELLAKCNPDNSHPEIDFGPPPISVGFKRLSDNATIPTKAHPSDSGFDLYAAEDVIIEPGETAIVPTNIAVDLPAGYEAQVRPRSGVTAKTKLRVQLGTIDNDYRGDIGVIVDNAEESTDKAIIMNDISGGMYVYPHNSYSIRKGDRIAQLVVQPMPSVQAYEIKGDMDSTSRGEKGFGSSGIGEDE